MKLKWKLNKLKKIITRTYLKKIKQIYQKLGKPFTLFSQSEEKVNVPHAP